MITCDILGPGTNNSGLGNQLFCVAATLGLAIKNNDAAAFPQLNRPPFDLYGRTIFHKLNKASVLSTEAYREPAYNSTIYHDIPYKPYMSLHGHFQSYKYFDHSKEEILNFFELPAHITSRVNKKYSNLIKNSSNMVSLHIRRGDYIKLAGHYAVLDSNYYKAALDIQDKDEIVVFSDDINWCKENLSFENKKMFFIENEMDIIDMYLMSKIQNNILANSTFSWWGAYLNNNKNRKIIGPQDWFGPNRTKSNEIETKDLMPPDWIRI